MIPFQFGLLRNHRENQRAVEMQKNKQASNCQYNDPSHICDSALPIHRWLNMFLHIMSNCWKVCLFINVYSCHFENARRWAPKTPHFIEFVLCSTATYRPHVLALVVLFFPQNQIIYQLFIVHGTVTRSFWKRGRHTFGVQGNLHGPKDTALRDTSIKYTKKCQINQNGGLFFNGRQFLIVSP